MFKFKKYSDYDLGVSQWFEMFVCPAIVFDDPKFGIKTNMCDHTVCGYLKGVLSDPTKPTILIRQNNQKKV